MDKKARLSGVLGLIAVGIAIIFAIVGIFFAQSISLPEPNYDEGAFHLSPGGLARFGIIVLSFYTGICYLISLPFSIMLVSKNKTNKGLLIIDGIIKSIAITRYLLTVGIAIDTGVSGQYFSPQNITYCIVGALMIVAVVASLVLEFQSFFALPKQPIDSQIER